MVTIREPLNRLVGSSEGPFGLTPGTLSRPFVVVVIRPIFSDPRVGRGTRNKEADILFELRILF